MTTFARAMSSVVGVQVGLALYGDPLYDVASHLHKMGYHSDEQACFLEQWGPLSPPHQPTTGKQISRPT
ncbi:hypothetical protein ACFXO9_34640 [Nocardia tengchongensis]|uniref:hypothetical protein n=1 Tax=Nocardia tengchongensis TaxID=2055889 RepID=UPI00367DD572